MRWTDNDWRERTKRLATKVGASPVLPVLGWTKVLESVIAGGPTLTWAAAGVVASIWFVVAEDLVEYVAGADETLQDYFDD